MNGIEGENVGAGSPSAVSQTLGRSDDYPNEYDDVLDRARTLGERITERVNTVLSETNSRVTQTGAPDNSGH